MKIPYGVPDFYSLRTEDQLYLDRTGYVAVIENLGKAFPRGGASRVNRSA